MIPIVAPAEMRVIDAAAPLPHDVLVERAGAAVARSAVRMLGGTYGRVVVVLAGPGSNGADGRVAARVLAASGVLVRVVDVGIDMAGGVPIDMPSPVHLVIDAAFGTGFRDAWQPPDVGDVPVLAVDLPSGVDAVTGEVRGGALRATRTVTFAAMKPGLLFGAGARLAGEVEVVDPAVVGLSPDALDGAAAHVVERHDVAAWMPRREVDAHKWRAAVRVVAGSPGMPGAASLLCTAALRSGAGMVHVSSPHGPLGGLPVEAVQVAPPSGLAAPDDLRRFGSVAVGPGLGRSDATRRAVDEALAAATRLDVPVVVDGDGLWALDGRPATAPVPHRAVLTPHEGEFERLAGGPVGGDRIDAARALARRTGCTVLLKGPTTVVANPDGEVLVTTTGDERLATAGTGDVLTGVIAALLAAGLEPLRAAAVAAWVHGASGVSAPRHGMMASDLVGTLPTMWAALVGDRR